MIPQERGDRWVAVIIAVGLHVLLLVILIRLTASRRTRSEMQQDAPATDEFLAYSRPVSGAAPQTGPLPRYYVQCNYSVLPAAREASLVDGPLQKPGRLGCSTTISLAKTITTAQLRIEYDRNGEIVEISGDQSFQGPETEAVVAGWRLARPRDGYRWLETPVYQVSIRARTN
jgi:hypothetical protein